jgi:hypothetical protein
MRESLLHQALRLHPDSLCAAATRVEAEIAWPRSGSLELSYVVSGRIGDLRLPPVVAAARADELWRHTCFEAFLQTSSSTAYYEFNFAPSGQWAAYQFSGYRRGMVIADVLCAPKIETVSNSAWYELKVLLQLNGLSKSESNSSWRLGLSAVIEESAGHTSYWALEHLTGKPDFHRADCFTSEIAAALGS